MPYGNFNRVTPPSIADMLKQFRSSAPNDTKTRKRKSFLPTTLQYKLSLPSIEDPLPGTPYQLFKKFKSDEVDQKDLHVTTQEFESLKKKLDAAEAENDKLELRNHKLHHLRQELEAVFSTEKDQLIAQRSDDKAKIWELEVKLEAIRKRESCVKQALLKTEAYHKSLNVLHTTSVKHHKAEIARLKGHMDEIRVTHEGKVKQSDVRIQALENDLSEMRRREAEWQSKGDEVLGQLTSQTTEQHQVASLQLQLANVTDKLKEAEEKAEKDDKIRETVLAQHQKLLHISKLEKDAISMKEETTRLWALVKNKILLAEKYEHLQVQLAGHDELQRDLQVLQVAHSKLEAHNQQWLAMAQEQFPEVNDLCVEKVRELVQKLLCDEAVGVTRQGELESLCKEEQGKVSRLSGDLHQLNQSYDAERTAKTHLFNQMKKLHKKLLLLTKERDSYRGLLDSMEGELTMSSPSVRQQHLESRVHKLEEMLGDYRGILEGTEIPIGRTFGAEGGESEQERLSKVNSELQQQLEQSKVELRQQSESLERLQLELEHRVLKGDFNPTSTKIVHFKMNPATVTSQEYEDSGARLQQECEYLRERVRLLEAGNVDDITRTVEAGVTASTLQNIEGLREQAKSFDLRQQRMKEAFKKTSQEYREVCYMLLGYKIDRLEHGHYRIMNIHAEDAEEYLIFKLGNGGLYMLETPYSATLGDSIELYLRQQQSIPMFLSAITMEGFSRQTMLDQSDTSTQP